MFVGHYGVSLAAKRWAPGLSLGWLFLAVQALDLLFAGLVLAGVEKMDIVPGFTAYNPYDLYFMPYSHSLLGALGWSALVALLARGLLGRRGAVAATVLGACVFSHWVLDVPMHTADMPLAGNDSMKIGLGLWHTSGCRSPPSWPFWRRASPSGCAPREESPARAAPRSCCSWC
jgi:hypothetical protein